MRMISLLLLALATPASATPDTPTSQEYWSRTEMNFKFLRQRILDCSGAKLLACVQALNVGAAEMKPPADFATKKEEKDKSPALGQKLQDFGPLGLYAAIVDKSKDSLRQKMQRIQAIRKARIAAVEELVKAGASIDV